MNNWTVDENNQPTDEFAITLKIVTDLIVGDQFNLSKNPHATACLILGTLSHRYDFEPEGYFGEFDWTVNSYTQMGNGSKAFLAAVADVEHLLKTELLAALTDGAAQVAYNIIMVLVEQHRLAPPANFLENFASLSN